MQTHLSIFISKKEKKNPCNEIFEIFSTLVINRSYYLSCHSSASFLFSPWQDFNRKYQVFVLISGVTSQSGTTCHVGCQQDFHNKIHLDQKLSEVITAGDEMKDRRRRLQVISIFRYVLLFLIFITSLPDFTRYLIYSSSSSRFCFQLLELLYA